MPLSNPRTKGARTVLIATFALLLLGVAGCGSGASGSSGSPTGSSSGGSGASTPTASSRPVSAAEVQAKLVTPADVPNSTADIPPTSGMLITLINKGLSVAACIKASGITQVVQPAVGTDVTDPNSQAGGEYATEVVILEADAGAATTDFQQATSGARACPPTSGQTAAGAGLTESQTTGSADVQVADWAGTRDSNTSTISPARNGVGTIADYAYFLRKGSGLIIVELDVGFLNVSASAQRQQQADQLAATLMQRLDTA